MSFDVSLAKRLGRLVIQTRFRSDAGLTALVGPSGAGKTTILNIIAGLMRADEGHVRVGQTLLQGPDVFLPAYRRRAGYVFQDNRLFPHRRVRANLLYGHRLAQNADRFMSLDEAIAFLGIGHLLDRWPNSLSGGEARRVSIGRALLSGPRFLLMDEPLSFLDKARRQEIMGVIRRIRDELGLPILYVTHDPAEVEELATHVVKVDPLPLGSAEDVQQFEET